MFPTCAPRERDGRPEAQEPPDPEVRGTSVTGATSGGVVSLICLGMTWLSDHGAPSYGVTAEHPWTSCAGGKNDARGSVVVADQLDRTL